jgi:Na+-driven multidrug efflux pump
MEVLEVGKSYVKGVTYIFAGRVIFFILNAIGFIIIARMLANIYGSSEPLGWLLVLLFIPSLTMLLGDLGIGYGAGNKCAKLFKERNFKELSSYAWSALYFSLILHVIYSVLTFFLGQFLVINLYSKPEILPYVHFLAMYILLNFFFGVAQGASINVNLICLSTSYTGSISSLSWFSILRPYFRIFYTYAFDFFNSWTYNFV